MEAHALLSDIITHGVTLRIKADNLVAIPATRLTPAQRTAIRQHKTELMALLAANDESPADRGRRRLGIIAKESGHAITDLLDWYQHDLDDLGNDTESNTRLIVFDYIKSSKIYRESVGQKVAHE